MEFELFADLSAEEQREVLMSARRRRYVAGETIFHEGDPGDSFHLVAKGRVLIRLSTANGEVVSFTLLSAGEGFGEQALLNDDSLRTASAQALEAVETLTLNRAAFEELCSRYPKVQWLLMRQLARQVRRLSQQVLDALYLPADKRVLRQVALLDEIYSRQFVPITQEDLASMAGTARPTVNRVLRAAVERGVVRVQRGGFTVIDRAALTRQAR